MAAEIGYFQFNYLPDPMPDTYEQPAPWEGCCEDGGGGGGGGGGCEACNYIGSGSPEGSQVAVPGSRYYDFTNDDHWIKFSGNSNTGWFPYIQ